MRHLHGTWPKLLAASAMMATTLPLAGCGPSEGTPKWCEKMMNKPRGEWTPHQEQVFNDKCAADQIQKQIKNLLGH